MAHAPQTEMIQGLMAEFDNRTDLVEAANRARLAGYSSMDAYTPFPIEELDDALGLKKNPLPLIVLLGGIFGGSGGFYHPHLAPEGTRPINNRRPPLFLRPHFLPVTLHCAGLCGALAAFVHHLALHRTPDASH